MYIRALVLLCVIAPSNLQILSRHVCVLIYVCEPSVVNHLSSNYFLTLPCNRIESATNLFFMPLNYESELHIRIDLVPGWLNCKCEQHANG